MINAETAFIVLLIIIVFFAIAAVAFGLYNWFYVSRLSSYLRKRRYKRFKEIFATEGIGILSNPFKWISYINNDLDIDDSNILRYKDKLRNGMKLFFVNVLTVWIVIAIIVIMALYLGGYD